MINASQPIGDSEKLRLVLDTNVFVSSLLSRRGNERTLVEVCLPGTFNVLYSGRLVDEIEEVVAREKFRKNFTLEEGLDLIDAIVLAGTEINDRPDQLLPHICDDPDDNFLFALYEDGQADLLVSGDKKVLKAGESAPWITAVDTRMAVTLLEEKERWGTRILTGDEETGWSIIDAEGNRAIFEAVSLFVNACEGIIDHKYDKL